MLKRLLYYISRFILSLTRNKIYINKSVVKNYKEFSLKKTHCFFGYYDLISIKNDKLLTHAQNSKSSNIGFFDINNGRYTEIAKEVTTSKQLGSRLTFITEDEIAFNKQINSNLHSFVYNLKTNDSSINNYPFYSYKNNLFYSLDFQELYKFRPEYGYNVKSLGPNSAVYCFSKSKNYFSKIVDKFELCKSQNLPINGYFNHLEFSKDGTFFSVQYNYLKNQEWFNVLLFYKNNMLISLFNLSGRFTHSKWCGDTLNFFTVLYSLNGKYKYIIIDPSKNTHNEIKINNFNNDLHPGDFVYQNKLLFDTYPDRTSQQRIYLAYFHHNYFEKNEIISIHHSIDYDFSKRTDLHPRVFGNLLNIDVKYSKWKKQMLVNYE